MAKSMTLDGTIAATPQQIWAVLTDLDQATGWHHGIQEITRLTEGKMGIGSSWIERRVGPDGREFTSTITVNVWEPPTKFGLHVDHKMLRMDLWFVLTPAGKATAVHYEGHLTGKGFGKLFAGKMLNMMKEVDGDMLDRLGAQVAKGSKKAKPSKPAAKGKAKKSKR